MKAAPTFLVWAGSILSASLISMGVFVVLGVIVPMLTFFVIYAQQNVYDSPGHGGAILMLTIPSAGGLAVVAFLLLARSLHRTLSRLLMKSSKSPLLFNG
jgi:hypothetical protein